MLGSLLRGPLRLAAAHGVSSPRHLLGMHVTFTRTLPTLLTPSRPYQTTSSVSNVARPPESEMSEEDYAIYVDLFQQYAKHRNGRFTLCPKDVSDLLDGIGRSSAVCADNQKITLGDRVTSPLLEQLFNVADKDGDGEIDMDEFLDHAHFFTGNNPARIILVVGGPGSGKGVLSDRLERECNVVHLSSGKLLRDEVAQGTALGQQAKEIMARGELVSSALMVALMKKRMRGHPGKRVLLDGFPRSLENARDLITLCGRPELALHLVCDDTILMERIMNRKAERDDDTFETALQRIRTYHKYHNQTIEWLREQHVPIVNLDCEGPPESVWQQLKAIGKLMRPAVKVRVKNDDKSKKAQGSQRRSSGEDNDSILFV